MNCDTGEFVSLDDDSFQLLKNRQLLSFPKYGLKHSGCYEQLWFLKATGTLNAKLLCT